MAIPQGIRRRRASKFQPRQHGADPAAAWSGSIRALYDDVVQEPLPADLLKLLAALGKEPTK